MEKLMVIDGNSIVNRAFYAIRPLTNSEGLHTNAVLGFLNILFKHIDEEKPDYISIAFDLPGPTFRHKQYEQYKAQRKGMPPELAEQMPLLKEVLSAMHINMLELAGYEADDIIGTLSALCEKEGVRCMVLTGDKDDLQLASEQTVIKLVTTRGGASSTVDYDSQKVLETYGVTPSEFIDVKGLMGDASDNIPGVAGIGEKTAFDLIGRFHSIEEIYASLEDMDIKPGIHTKLAAGRESAFLSRSLATIDRAAPISFGFGDARVQEYDAPRLLAVLRRLELGSVITRLDLTAKEGVASSSPPSFEAVDLSELRLEVSRTGLLFYHMENGKITASWGEGGTCTDTAEAFFDLLADGSIRKVGHGMKKELTAGIAVNNLYFDTEIAAYVIAPSRSSYQIFALAGEYLGYAPTGDAASIVRAIAGLYGYFKEQISAQEQEKLFYEIEMPLVAVLADMQTTGVAVDLAMLGAFSRSLGESIDRLTAGIYEYAGSEFNINSPKQLGEVLFERLRLPVFKKTKTGYSTDVEVLEKLKGSHPIIDLLMEFRHLVKLKGTYADGLAAVVNPQTGRIHSSFNQTVTATGRISSTEPNMQNIPVRTPLGRELRRVFIAGGADRVLVDADYSQIELRVLAHIADDSTMIEAFANDLDIHTQTAAQVFGVSPETVTGEMRTRAKAVNFGIVYGIGAFSLSQDLGISVSEAKLYIESYLETFSGVRQYMHSVVEAGKEQGYVTTLLNRRRYLPELKTNNFVTRSYGERIAMNTPIQGSAADIIKIAMVRVHRRLKEEGLRSKLVLQVHDELIVEAYKDEAARVKVILKEEMEGALVLKAPLRVDMSTGGTWYDAK